MRKILQVHTLNRKIRKNRLPNENKQVVASKLTEMDHKRENCTTYSDERVFHLSKVIFLNIFQSVSMLKYSEEKFSQKLIKWILEFLNWH